MTLTPLRPVLYSRALHRWSIVHSRFPRIGSVVSQSLKLLENYNNAQCKADSTEKFKMLNRSHNKAACSAISSFFLAFFAAVVIIVVVFPITWPPSSFSESVPHLDPLTGKFASNCFWKSHFHYLRSLSKRKRIRRRYGRYISRLQCSAR